ncbi:hypothetical protein EI94DRAFT_499802 [Lactarius quietus]|nr:hypothetical protein EI94DRAFT_499802 [Lactarius quietus]
MMLRKSLRSWLHCILCNRLSIHYYKLLVLHFSPGFFSRSCLSCSSFFVLFIPLRSALIHHLFLVRLLSLSSLVSSPFYLLFCVCIHLSLSFGARRMHSPVSHLRPLLTSAHNPYVRARNNMLWAYGCTVRLLPTVASE